MENESKGNVYSDSTYFYRARSLFLYRYTIFLKKRFLCDRNFRGREGKYLYGGSKDENFSGILPEIYRAHCNAV